MNSKVLVVDDQEHIRQVCQENLEMDGFEVFLAENGKKALEQAKNTNPDVILLDVMMPEMSGWEVLEWLKTNDDCKDISVIMLTAISNPTEQTKALDAGAADFIVKPFDLEVMIARVKAHSELKRAKDKLKKTNKELETRLEQANHLAFIGMESASIAHDLGNVVFQTRIEKILRKKLDKLWNQPGDQETYEDIIGWIKALELSASELESIVRGLAYLSSGKILDKAKTDLVSIVESTTMLYSRRASKQHVEITFEKQSVLVNCDISFSRVIINLLKNALEALSSIPLEERKRKIKISCGEKENEAFFRIEDNGPGIPIELQEKILQGHTTKKNGHGIGLSGSHKIVQRHNGRIEVTSEPGNGAAFTVFLPRVF